jgi:hypothetical protein
MQYTNYTNLDAGFWRPYEPGDRLVKGFTGDIEFPRGVAALEAIFVRHNRDDRPDGQLCPSMSVGDVIVLGETAWSVANVGFTPVTVDPADAITDRTWTEVR